MMMITTKMSNVYKLKYFVFILINGLKQNRRIK
jgi:hypothetical protein